MNYYACGERVRVPEGTPAAPQGWQGQRGTVVGAFFPPALGSPEPKAAPRERPAAEPQIEYYVRFDSGEAHSLPPEWISRTASE